MAYCFGRSRTTNVLRACGRHREDAKRIFFSVHRWEGKELDRQLHLAAVDKELHDAYNCTQEAMEVKSLHKYSTLMWTKDAQVGG